MHHVRALMRRLLKGLPPTPTPRQVLKLQPKLDGLEDRVVLSHLGSVGSRLASQAAARQARGAGGGIVGRRLALRQAAYRLSSSSSTSSTDASSTEHGTCTSGDGNNSAPNDTQLQTDLGTLRTDLNSVLSGSAVTDAQRLALRNDLRSIGEANSTFNIDKTALASAADTLLNALADGTYDSDTNVADSIKTSFDNLFTDSNIDQTLIDQTFTDFVVVARGLNVSTDEITRLAADRSAIESDLARLGIDTSTGHGFRYSASNVDLILGGRGPGIGFGFRGRHFGRFRQ